MKKLIIVFFLLTGFKSQAQALLLGDSEAEIKIQLEKLDGFVFKEKSFLKNDVTVLKFRHTQSTVDLGYYLKDDVCITIQQIIPRKLLIDFIKGSNNQYRKASDNIWISKDNETKIELKFLDNDDSYFTVFFTSIK